MTDQKNKVRNGLLFDLCNKYALFPRPLLLQLIWQDPDLSKKFFDRYGWRPPQVDAVSKSQMCQLLTENKFTPITKSSIRSDPVKYRRALRALSQMDFEREKKVLLDMAHQLATDEMAKEEFQTLQDIDYKRFQEGRPEDYRRWFGFAAEAVPIPETTVQRIRAKAAQFHQEDIEGGRLPEEQEGIVYILYPDGRIDSTKSGVLYGARSVFSVAPPLVELVDASPFQFGGADHSVTFKHKKKARNIRELMKQSLAISLADQAATLALLSKRKLYGDVLKHISKYTHGSINPWTNKPM